MSAWIHILLPQLCVIALAVLVLLADSFAGLRGRVLGAVTAAGLFAILISTWFVNVAGADPHGVFVSGPWVVFFSRVFLTAAILGVLGSMAWLERKTAGRQAEYHVMMLLSLVGMMLIPGARDWVLLVVAFELMGLPLYVMAAWEKVDGAVESPRLGAEAALKLYVTGAASSALTIFGLAIVTGMSGTTKLALAGGPIQPITAVGMMLVLAGFGFKIGAVPFHMWVADTYQGAATPFVAFLSVAPKAGGLAALAVVLLSGWATQSAIWGPALAAISVASMFAGNFFALPQTDVRRLLGFSGIAQIGYVLVGIVSRTEQGAAMSLFFIATYVFTNMGAFLIVHAAAESSGGHSVSALAGLSKRSPWLGGALLVFLLSLAGIPFVAGFWAKLFLFLAAWRAGFPGLVIAGVAFAVVGLFYYLGVARSTFMSDGTQQGPIKTDGALALAVAICLVAVVGFGLAPGPLVEEATRASIMFTLGK